MKRKLYNKLIEWKKNSNGTTALVIDGARRVGKSYIVEQFAQENYKSYIILDFNIVPKDVKELFENYLNDIDTLFMYLSNYYNIKLYNRETLIIFDEVQLYPRARSAIKYLVKDGRYDYIETGLLMSIKKNTKDILIPKDLNLDNLSEFKTKIDEVISTKNLANFLEYKNLILKDSSFAPAYYSLAVALDNSEKYDEAIKNYEKFVSLKGNEKDNMTEFAVGRIKELKDYLAQVNGNQK